VWTGSTAEEIRLADFPDQPFLIAAHDQVIRRHVNERGTWEPGLAAFVGAFLPANPRVVIGGGHVGLSAFQLWRERPDISELVVFEPDSVNAGLLALNVWSWGENPVRVVPLGLGRASGELTLSQNPSNTGDNRLWQSDAPWPRETVLVSALDDIWRGRLDLLLLDTQGWEPDVLAGAERVIRDEKPLLVFEWWPQALATRGIDSFEVLAWLERDLRLRVEIVPADASGIHELLPDAVEIRDVRELTRRLLDHPEQTIHAELLARATTSSKHGRAS
jgi:FkbM family methyltransferase